MGWPSPSTPSTSLPPWPGASRVTESTLLLVRLAGGWPGAIIAQQWLRHKSSKASFRAAFSITVAANLVALFTLATPLTTWR